MMSRIEKWSHAVDDVHIFIKNINFYQNPFSTTIQKFIHSNLFTSSSKLTRVTPSILVNEINEPLED